MILFGLRGVGSGNACLPAVKILKETVPVSVYAEEPAFSRFRDHFDLIPESEWEGLLDRFHPSLVVATCATIGGNIPKHLIHEAKKRNLPVVLVEDNWNSHSSFDWPILPDGVCLVNEFAKKLLLQSWPRYPESNIHITGAPVFDKYSKAQTENAGSRLRRFLCLDEDWPVVFFIGENWGMPQAVSMLVYALNIINLPVYFILRDHPTMVAPNAPDEYKHLYAEYHDVLKKLWVGPVIDSRELTSNEVLAGSDVVVGICSTMLEEACYLRQPVINVWTPEIGQILFDKARYTYEEQPITYLGASLKAESVKEIRSCLQRILAGDTVAMLQAQQKHFQTDGLSGERVAKAILNYYKC